MAEAPETDEAGVYALQSELPLIYLAMEEQAEIDAVFEQNAKLTFISTNDGALIRQLQLPVPKGAEIVSFSAARPTSVVMALDAFAHLDTDKAVEVWKEDRKVDSEYDSLMRELMTYMMEDPRSIPSILGAMFAARAIERIGDRATNICEYVIYLVKGKDVRHTRVDQQS